MESPTKKKKSDHHTDELLNPFSPFPSPFPFTSSTPLTALINEGVMTPFLTGMTPSIHENHQVPSSRDWTPSMRESIAEGFELQHAMSPPANKQRNNRGKRDSAHINALASPLFPDLSEADGIFDTEAQTQLMKNKEALANRIKATEANHSKPHFPHSKKNGLSDNNKIMLGDIQTLSKSSLLGEVMNPSSTASVYKYGIAEKSLFSGIESLSSSQQSDNSGLAAITAAADNLPPLEINTNLPSPIVKTAISHPKKQRLKTKEDTGFSAPSSPLKQPHTLSSFASSNHNQNNNNSSQPLLAAFSRNNSTSSQPTIASLSSTPYRSKSLNTIEDKAKIEEIIQIGIARAAQQRADDIKTVTCNCKKSKCLKMYCDCFRLTEYCKKTCNCYECNNTEMYEESRQLAIRSITERNPEAFKPRVITEEENNNNKSHLTGCHCRKSACLKKYCECFTGNVPCTNRCRCIDCKNVPELYHLDESIRKQAFALTQSTSSASKSSTARTPSSSARAQQQTLFNSPRGKDLPNTKLSFNEHPSAGSGNRIVESDHSNLTTSTLYSTDGSVLAASTTTKDVPVSINVTSPHRPKYKAMTSPELRGLSAFDIRQTAESVGSESTNTERSRKIDGYTPSSPLKTSSNHNNTNTNDALLSPIKLLELADVAMNIQEFVLSSQLSDNLTPDD